MVRTGTQCVTKTTTARKCRVLRPREHEREVNEARGSGMRRKASRHSRTKKGGILPLVPIILGALGALGSAAGGASAIANAVNNKKAQQRQLTEMIRHNAAMEAKAGRGVKMQKRGKRKSAQGAILRLRATSRRCPKN